MSDIEHPENIMPPPSADGFMFCLWNAVGGDPDLYKQARAGLIPCPIADTCEIRAAHLVLLAQREASVVWAGLTRAQQRRINNKAQAVLFEAERQLGAHVVGPVVKTWLENEVGALIGVKMRKLFPLPQAIEPAPPHPVPGIKPAGKPVQLSLF
ncbi:MAG: hypothetical protein JW934_08070 [Anaerolineae bacterium]|nr:hypothetical protein [Anaerolineae bacterium]